MTVSVGIPALTDRQPDLLTARIFYDDPDGSSSFWINNVSEPTPMNHKSILNCKAAAEWLAGEEFTHGVTIQLQQRRREITGRSWELALTLGLASLLTGQLLNPSMTFTGTVGAGGLVLAVGDLPEKVAASRRAGYRTLLISKEQSWEPLGGGLQVQTVENIRDAWAIASSQSVKVKSVNKQTVGRP